MIYLFNPFVGHVLSAVKENIRKSLVRAPRKLTLIYMFPHKKQGDARADCQWLPVRRTLSDDIWVDVRVVIYESDPHGTSMNCRPLAPPDATLARPPDPFVENPG